jgi:uncharacterized protein YsxB (DUF464 family)
MITITIFQDQKSVTRFRCTGHAGYAEAGSDIICAGVSALVINTINSIEEFTDARYKIDTDEESGLIDFTLQEKAGHDTSLLLKSMVLGLQGIQTDYGDEYIVLNYKEV